MTSREKMNHNRVLLSCLVSIILLSTLTGCTQQSNQSQVPPTKASVLTMLGKAENITSLYYDINGTLTMNGINGSSNQTSLSTQLLNIKVWDKKPYLKEQITVTVIGIPTTVQIIQRPEGTYVYNALTKKWNLTIGIPSYVTALKYIDPAMIKDLLNNQTVTNFPTQTIDGKQTTLINLTVGMLNNQSIIISVWIWNDMGVPLKAIVTFNTDIKMSLHFLFSNYSFETIPDSEFNVT